MTPEEIRLEIYKRRKQINQAKIARQLGVTRQSVVLVIDRRMKSRRIREAIAKAIGVDVSTVFPEETAKVAKQ
jgi:DNA-binding XRE family transcriptional regulator